MVPEAIFADHRIVADGEPRLVWPRGAVLTLERGEGEVIVRSDQPPSADAIAMFQERAGEAVGDLRWNDVSLVLRPASGWSMDARLVGPMLIVAFQRMARNETPGGPVTEASEVAHAVIEADLAAGYPGRAAARRKRCWRAIRDDRRAARLLADARALDNDIAGAGRDYRAQGATDRAAQR